MDQCEEFLKICRSGHLTAVENCLREGIHPNIQDLEGESALQIAAANGFDDIVKLLLRYGASIDLSNHYGWTPLMHAARHGHSLTVSLLLKMKAKVNICNRLGLRAIDVAAWNGQLSNVKLLIEAGAIVDNVSSVGQSNECDLSPLMAASLQGHDTVLRFLLENGAAVNQVSPITGLTPLMLAAYNGHKQIVQIIVEWGGDANKVDICGRTALALAIACSKRDVKAYLENMTITKARNGRNFQNTDILQAVRNGDILKVKSILSQIQNSSNTFDSDDGITPLMLASMLGYNNIVNVLVSNGAKLDIQDLSNGWTALMYAVFHRRPDTVKFLIERGADAGIRATNGYTALDLARHIDSSETGIIESLATCEISDIDFQKKSCSSSSPIVASRRKNSSSGKFSPRSPSQSRLKDWLGGVAQKMFTRQSLKFSASNVTSSMVVDDLQVPAETLNDVFEDKNCSYKVPEGATLSLSTLLSPNRHLSSALREQTVEAITPPLLSSSTTYMDFMKNISPRRLPKDKSQRHVTSLQLPTLLKDYRRDNMLVKEASKTHPLPPAHLTISPDLSETYNSQTCSTFSQTKISESENKALDSSVEGELTALLNKESLKKYVQKFRDQEVDLEAFQCLTEEDLNEIGIQSFESRKKLMELIKKSQNI